MILTFHSHPDITVVFGVENLADPHDFNNWQTIENATIFPHPDFNITTRHNDIAVIKVPYAPTIVPGRLIFQESPI